MPNWSEQASAAIVRYEAGESRDLDQRQLTQLANAAWAAGLCLLMDGRRDESALWLRRAAGRYRESWGDAPADSWGRPIAAMKALLLAGDDASDAARWALDAGAAEAESPIGRYAATLALIILHRDAEARVLAETLVGRDDFPRDVADALWMIAGFDRTEYAIAIENMIEDFEGRSEFLEGVRVADTILVLQVLAAEREMAVEVPPESAGHFPAIEGPASR